jgi:hypothetical protein
MKDKINKESVKKLIYLNSYNKEIVLKNVRTKKLEVYKISKL